MFSGTSHNLKGTVFVPKAPCSMGSLVPGCVARSSHAEMLLLLPGCWYRGLYVQGLLTAGFVVRGGLPHFYELVLFWNLVPGTRLGAFLGIKVGRSKYFLMSSLCHRFSGRSLPLTRGHVPLCGVSSAQWLCVPVLCSSDHCCLVSGQLWPLPTKGSPCRRH